LLQALSNHDDAEHLTFRCTLCICRPQTSVRSLYFELSRRLHESSVFIVSKSGHGFGRRTSGEASWPPFLSKRSSLRVADDEWRKRKEMIDNIELQRAAQRTILYSRANPLRRGFLVKEQFLNFELTHVLSHTVQPFITSRT
jgi:hypothetical protein